MLSGVVPNHAKYTQGGMPIGLDSKRRTIRLVPQTGTGDYTPGGNNMIRIDIPNSIGFLDTQNNYLRFRIKSAVQFSSIKSITFILMRCHLDLAGMVILVGDPMGE